MAAEISGTIQSSFSRSTGQQLSANQLRQLAPPQLVDLFPELSTRYGVLLQFKLWLTLQDQITALERWIRNDLARPDRLMRLQSVPGIGPVLGMTILLESGAIERFASVGDYASYCRMVESVRLSNGKRKGTAIASAATAICAGLSWKRPTMPCATTRSSDAGTSANARASIASSPSMRWLISFRRFRRVTTIVTMSDADRH